MDEKFSAQKDAQEKAIDTKVENAATGVAELFNEDAEDDEVDVEAINAKLEEF